MTDLWIIAIATAVMVVAVLVWKLWPEAKEPKGWFAGPLINGENRSVSVKVDADGSFDFPQPSWEAGHVHYVTKACGPLTGKMRLRYRIDMAEGAAFKSDTGGLGWITLYFQRKGDNWSARGKYETYRWYGVHAPLEAGEHTIEASDLWGAVEVSTSETAPAEFVEALKNAHRVGFVFGGGSGWGHGAYATAPAWFTLLEFSA